MKYLLIIPDGAADFPLDQLDGRTPLEAARIPHMDGLARRGRQGTVATTPQGMACGSDVCSMSLLGYDPARYHTGRAPLEAAALGIPLGDHDWIFRVNLVTVIDGRMQDHSAGHITSPEGRRLLEEFAPRADLPGTELFPGVSYRNIMVDRPRKDGAGRDWSELVTVPPHDIPGEPIRKHLPVGGEHAGLLQQMIADSEVFLADHEINKTRLEMGELPATHLWPWGQGTRPAMPAFVEKFGLRGAMITAVDLLAGIASFIGWDRLDAADADPKVAAIEAIDRHVVGPCVAALEARGEPYRVLVLPDHYTRVDNRKHDPTPVPFLMAGHKVRGVVERPFSEANANEADLHIAHGHELMEYFLRSALG